MQDLQYYLMIFSFLYILFFSFIAREKLRTGGLDGFSSFLSGVVSPVALAWIIYSQIEQSKVIALNTQYLKEQIEETKLQKLPFLHMQIKEVQKEITTTEKLLNKIFIEDITKNGQFNIIKLDEQLRFKKVINSIKKAGNNYQELSTVEIGITNSGADIYNLTIQKRKPESLTKVLSGPQHILKNETRKFNILIPTIYLYEFKDEPLYLEIKYKDKTQKTQKKLLSIKVKQELYNKREEIIKSIDSEFIEDKNKNPVAYKERLFRVLKIDLDFFDFTIQPFQSEIKQYDH